MHSTLATALPGSWLASRLGADPREIERLRERGELLAVCDQGEWLYPVWQFGPGGSIPAGVREAVKAARSVGLDEARLVALLRRPAGLLTVEVDQCPGGLALDPQRPVHAAPASRRQQRRRDEDDKSSHE